MTKRVVVTGSGGLLAHAMRETAPLDLDLRFLDHISFDLTDTALMERGLSELEPDAVINTAAYNNVNRCEVERDLSWAVNATGPQELAKLCAKRGIPLVHYGTDYVFDGEKTTPYGEGDPTNPVNHYGAGKLAGEQAVLDASPRHLVLRTSWVFGFHPTQTKTFVHTILRQAAQGGTLRSAVDQASVPTYSGDLARWTFDLLSNGATGLLHAVNDEPVSRFDWARAIVAEAAGVGLLQAAPAVEPVSAGHFAGEVRRPSYSVMNNERMAVRLGRRPGSWRAGLRAMLAEQARQSQRDVPLASHSAKR